MGKKSREKGKRGEREAAGVLSHLLGIPISRGVQYKGTKDSPDLSGLDAHGLHPEVKRDESTVSKKMYAAISQAQEESDNSTPFVMSRRNGSEWLITIRVEDLLEFARKINEIRT